MFRRNDTISDKAEAFTKDAGKSVEEMGREVGHYADEAKSNMVKTLHDTAKNLRKQAREAGANDEVVDRIDEVATGFEKAASYLKHHSYGDMGEDAVKTVKRYPAQTLAVIFVVGVIIGLILRGDSHPAYQNQAGRAYRNSNNF